MQHKFKVKIYKTEWESNPGCPVSNHSNHYTIEDLL